MLVLSRKIGERIVIDDRITITITRVSGGRVSVGIQAPGGMRIVRGELKPLPQSDSSASESSPATTEPTSRCEAHLDLPLTLSALADFVSRSSTSSPSTG